MSPDSSCLFTAPQAFFINCHYLLHKMSKTTMLSFKLTKKSRSIIPKLRQPQKTWQDCSCQIRKTYRKRLKGKLLQRLIATGCWKLVKSELAELKTHYYSCFSKNMVEIYKVFNHACFCNRAPFAVVIGSMKMYYYYTHTQLLRSDWLCLLYLFFNTRKFFPFQSIFVTYITKASAVIILHG